MIKIENLTKSYGSFMAVDSISFDVKKGEILGFLGPNGAGKTSTMRVLTCFMPPTSGRVEVAGFDAFSFPNEIKKRIGYLPESAPLYKELKVTEFLKFVASIKGLSGAEMHKKIDEAIEMTGIKDVEGRLIAHLSKGYRQRVGLAQALLNDPEILILDEPTEGLDPKQIVEIREVIKGVAGGERTVILSSHILPEVSKLCDRVVIINKGKIVAIDSPNHLTSSRQKKTIIEILIEGDVNEIKQALSGMMGILDVELIESKKDNEHLFSVTAGTGEDIRSDISSFIVQKKFGLLEMKQKTLSLEDVFVDLVTDEKITEEEVEKTK